MRSIPVLQAARRSSVFLYGFRFTHRRKNHLEFFVKHLTTALHVVNTVSPISCTVPAALPVSLVDGYVVCANNAAITNTGKTGSIRVTKVDVQAGTFEIGNFDDFTASKNSIALSINGCSTKGAGSLTLADGAFPAIAAEKNLAIRYKAKVSASEAVTNINAATIVFTIAAVTDKEAA